MDKETKYPRKVKTQLPLTYYHTGYLFSCYWNSPSMGFISSITEEIQCTNFISNMAAALHDPNIRKTK